MQTYVFVPSEKFSTQRLKFNATSLRGQALNSLRPGEKYVHQSTGSPLLRVTSYHLFGDNQSPEPMVTYRQLSSSITNCREMGTQRYSLILRKCIHKYVQHVNCSVQTSISRPLTHWLLGNLKNKIQNVFFKLIS